TLPARPTRGNCVSVCIQNSSSHVSTTFVRTSRRALWGDRAAYLHPDRALARIGERDDVSRVTTSQERPHASPATVTLVVRRGRSAAARSAVRRERVEPSRGAVHRRASEGRRHRLLYVPQLRVRPLRLRHIDRELSAAPRRLRRTELLHAR